MVRAKTGIMEGEHDSAPEAAPESPDTDSAPAGAVNPPPPPPSEPPPSAPLEYAPYSPPPVSAPIPVPSAFAPPRPKRGRSRKLLIVGIVAVFLILVLGGGAVLVNASLSSTYSSKRAVTDYFAAQARGDVNAMMSNATFVNADTTSSQFFTKAAVTAMMSTAENRAISNVAVTSAQDLDSSTSKLTVSMTWNGTPRTQTYVVRKDASRVHDFFYNSWRVEIPSTNINVNLPNQPGDVQVDGISVTSALLITVIQGYHTVTMLNTAFYDETSQTADAADAAPTVTFPSKMGAVAMAAAVAAVKAAFANVTCDASKYYNCPGHAYKVPATDAYDVLEAAGGNINAYSSWSIAFTGDPTTGMTLVITTDAGKVTASGACAMTLTVDGSHKYNFKGTWSGTLTWSNGGFGSDMTENCDSTRA
jgi:uncharacterized membrane protein